VIDFCVGLWGWRIRVIGVSLCLALSACLDLSSANKQGYVMVKIQSAPVVYHGRWDFSDADGPLASWPGFAWETSFTGASCKVVMSDGKNYYNVWIDGAFHKVVGGRSGSNMVLHVADGLKPGKHHLRMQRRNISLGRATQLHGFLLEPHQVLLAPQKRAAPVVEWIGDSFSLGEGNEAMQQEISWGETQAVTNFSKSFAAFVADHYRAEILPVCRSGSGLVCNHRGSRAKAIPERYGWSLMESGANAWSGYECSPKVIAVCLGLNDYSGMSRADGSVSEEDSATFRQAYLAMIHRLRKQAPDARIVIVAPHVKWVREQATHCMVRARHEGVKRIDFVKFDYFPGGYVANEHPHVETHEKIARQIIEQWDRLGISHELR